MKRWDPLAIPYYLMVGLLAYFVILPVVGVVLYGVFPFESLQYLLESAGRSLPYLGRSLIIAVFVTGFSVAIGLAASIALWRFEFRGRRLLRYAMVLPMINPPFVGSIAFIMLFGKRGLITHGLLGLSVSPFGWVGIAVMEILSLSALAYLIISSSVVKIDTSIEDAARNLGTSELAIFRDITLRSMAPEISAAAVLVFLASMADFGTPLIIGGAYQTLASDLYIQITGLYDMRSAAVSGTLLLLPCMLLFAVQRRLVKKKNYYALGIANPDIVYRHYSRPLRRIMTGLAGLYGFLVTMKYLFIVMGAFTRQWGYDYAPTLIHVKKVLERDFSPFLNSIQLAFLSAFFASMAGVLLSYLIKRKGFRLKRTADLVATLPAAVPGILMGVGYLVAFKYPLLGIGRFWMRELPSVILLGTGIIIYLICIFRYMNVGLRTGYALLEHLNPNIEEAARNLGQTEGRIFSEIALPLMAPAFSSAFFKNFSTTMTTLGAIIFLLLPSNKVAVQQIFQIITSSAMGVAAAMALMLSLTTAVMLAVFRIINAKLLRIKP